MSWWMIYLLSDTLATVQATVQPPPKLMVVILSENYPKSLILAVTLLTK